jgi:putative transposase
MPHSFVSNYMHCVFSTKGRQLSITPDLQKRLWLYLGGIARENKMCPVVINGMEDHAHLLFALPSTISISKALQLIKGGSSKWIHDLKSTSRFDQLFPAYIRIFGHPNKPIQSR